MTLSAPLPFTDESKALLKRYSYEELANFVESSWLTITSECKYFLSIWRKAPNNVLLNIDYDLAIGYFVEKSGSWKTDEARLVRLELRRRRRHNLPKHFA